MLLISSMVGLAPPFWQNMRKIQIITSASKRLGSLQGLTIFIIINLGRGLEIEKKSINLNRDDGWNISRRWVPVLSTQFFFFFMQVLASFLQYLLLIYSSLEFIFLILRIFLCILSSYSFLTPFSIFVICLMGLSSIFYC